MQKFGKGYEKISDVNCPGITNSRERPPTRSKREAGEKFLESRGSSAVRKSHAQERWPSRRLCHCQP